MCEKALDDEVGLGENTHFQYFPLLFAFFLFLVLSFSLFCYGVMVLWCYHYRVMVLSLLSYNYCSNVITTFIINII